MLITDMLMWWYGAGWMHVVSTAGHSLRKLYYSLSVKQMFRTILAPWKEDRMESGQGLDQMFRALIMNSVARLIGFVIRSIFIVMWLLATTLMLTVSIALFLIWPIIPFMPIIALIYGSVGLF